MAERKAQIELALGDALDHLLDRGVVITGEAIISIGSIDLLYLGLNLVLANVDTLKRAAEKNPSPLAPLPGGERGTE